MGDLLITVGFIAGFTVIGTLVIPAIVWFRTMLEHRENRRLLRRISRIHTISNDVVSYDLSGTGKLVIDCQNDSTFVVPKQGPPIVLADFQATDRQNAQMHFGQLFDAQPGLLIDRQRHKGLFLRDATVDHVLRESDCMLSAGDLTTIEVIDHEKSSIMQKRDVAGERRGCW